MNSTADLMWNIWTESANATQATLSDYCTGRRFRQLLTDGKISEGDVILMLTADGFCPFKKTNYVMKPIYSMLKFICLFVVFFLSFFLSFFSF
jgi:hypothetical protein